MLPNPLHPAIVHFPIVLSVLLPIAAVVALWVIRRGGNRSRTWLVPAALAVALVASGWVALKTGEAEEERVEAYVSESAIHEHEEAAERFLLFSGIVAAIALGGLVTGTVGAAARIVATAGSVIVLAAAVAVGAAGGELVYEHGAAQAYVTGSATPDALDRAHGEEADEDRRERGGGAP